MSDEIADRHAGPRRGFGSVRVRVTVGDTTWTTSVFPDAKRSAYVLPVRKDVRTKEGVTAGERVTIGLVVIAD